MNWLTIIEIINLTLIKTLIEIVILILIKIIDHLHQIDRLKTQITEAEEIK